MPGPPHREWTARHHRRHVCATVPQLPVAPAVHPNQQCHQDRNSPCVGGDLKRSDEHRLSQVDKRIYKRTKETVEQSFADAKQLHGHRSPSIPRTGPCAAVSLGWPPQPIIKKIALLLSRTGRNLPLSKVGNRSIDPYRPVPAPSPACPAVRALKPQSYNPPQTTNPAKMTRVVSSLSSLR